MARNVDTGLTKETTAAADGFYRLLLLPVGQYSITVEATDFAKLVQQPIQVNGEPDRAVDSPAPGRVASETVTVTSQAPLVDASTNTLGKVVSGREIVDLPLNGRNFTQLGLLQTGVAPLTAGVATAGGSLAARRRDDLAQNPFNLAAERGPSLFDARHRIVASGSWEPHFPTGAPSAVKAIFDGWQVNGIAAHNSGTPFTVSDSTNVSLQANSPPISGFAASRPNLVGDPNGGPHTVDEWISRLAFQRLNPVRQAGQFGDAGGTSHAGLVHQPGRVAVRNFGLNDAVRLQFRAEAFNVLNHPNFGLPVADLNNANLGRIFSAAPPRLIQFALKLIL